VIFNKLGLILFSIFSIFLLSTNVWAQRYEDSVVYGEDNRKEYYQIENPKLKEIADSVPALISPSNVYIDSKTKSAYIVTSSYAQEFGLCSNEPFVEQAIAPTCSAALIAPDLVLTAGHCVQGKICREMMFVFGFKLDAPKQLPQIVSTCEVYGCDSIVDQATLNSEFAIVRLSRPVTNHKPIQVNKGAAPVVGTPLVLMGYPSGLPFKIAEGGFVRSINEADSFFLANVDSYHGNSGSPIINAKTGMIEGVLVNGEVDYEYNQQNRCFLSKRCEMDGCKGEKVTKALKFTKYLP
jgi:hypothetical protein